MSVKIKLLTVVPQFTVTDLVRTAEYYRDVLGFQIDSYWDGKRASVVPTGIPVFAIVRRSDIEVFFSRADQSEARTGRAKGAYDLYVRVVGIDSLAEELRSRGADILDGPATRVYGQREVVVRDCNGLVIAFGEETDGRSAREENA
jgi:uncharacterized glyoxalase superfamily protein PhnB